MAPERRGRELGRACAVCGRPVAPGAGFVLGGALRCWRHGLQYRPLLTRSLKTALLVGTLLTLINQGTVLVAGQFPPDLLWKIPLTYAVPFCVATWGALANTRV